MDFFIRDDCDPLHGDSGCHFEDGQGTLGPIAKNSIAVKTTTMLTFAGNGSGMISYSDIVHVSTVLLNLLTFLLGMDHVFGLWSVNLSVIWIVK